MRCPTFNKEGRDDKDNGGEKEENQDREAHSSSQGWPSSGCGDHSVYCMIQYKEKTFRLYESEIRATSSHDSHDMRP